MINSQTYTARAWGQEDRTAGSMPGVTTGANAEGGKFSDMVSDAQNASETKESSATDKSTETHHKKHGGFLDFILAIIDIINPLQHIPVISTIYRHITGDEISPMARVAGDALYGGPIGAAVGLADVAIEKKTGKDIGTNVMAMLSGKHGHGGKKESDETDVAQNANGQRLMDIAWNAPATQALPPIDIPVQGEAANDAVPASATQHRGGKHTSPAMGPEAPHIIVPRPRPENAPAAKGDDSTPAPHGDDMVQMTVDPAAVEPAAGNDDSSQNALAAFARDMRGGASANAETSMTATAEIDVTDQIRQDFRSTPGPAPTKLSYRTGSSANEPGAYSYKEGSVQSTKSGPAASTGKMPAQGMVNVKTALQSQEVSADAGENRAVPPGLIAKQMMAGLDKYAAMQRLTPAAGSAAAF